MLKALRYEILRNIKASGTIKIPLTERPVRVATMLDEARFNEDQLLIHNTTVFLEDALHDWNWKDGQFRYYTHVAERADVLIVYEMDSKYTPPAKFCAESGKPLSPQA